MARSSAPALPPPGSPWRWPLVLVAVPVAFVSAVVSLAFQHTAAAVICGVVALPVLVALVGLRRRQSGAEGEVARLRAELADREAETVQRLAALEADSVRREEYWRDEVTERLTRQAERVRAETEHLVEERLPAALARTEIPAPPDRPDSGDLPDPSVTEWFDRLLTEVSGAVAHREESQRLALVELASRVQTSAHRIQAAVTGLADRHPGDSELLETTMRVDHAATQQARHAQSLKVLCGEWPGQQWQKPLAMVDVVRAASGRIVAFKRIEVTGDPNVGVAPSVVEPLIHLLAELLANATEYSPPRTGVPVTVRTVQRGAVIEVDDGGLGMDEYRMAQVRPIASGCRLLGVGEVGEIPQTGLAVVGRFADRHGFQVDLGPSPYGGVRAVVLVPTESLETLAPAGSSVPAPPASGAPRRPAAPVAASPGPAPSVPTPPVSAPSVPTAGETVLPGASGPGDAAEPQRSPARRLPQRRSRRDAYAPAVEAAPTAITPPGTPEQAGDWMEQFFEGGVSLPPPGSVPHKGQDGPSSPTTDSPEGLV